MRRDIAGQGFAWIPSAAWSIDPELEPHWQRLREDWDHLELDRYLEHGATFRLRRYGRYYWSPASDALLALPHEPYFQPKDENSYAGGIEREFAPLLPDTVHNPFLAALVRCTFACLPVARERREHPWEVRIHQIRIVASTDQPGQPAPEGIHQDGTDFLTLHLVRRHNVVGGQEHDLRSGPQTDLVLHHARAARLTDSGGSANHARSDACAFRGRTHRRVLGTCSESTSSMNPPAYERPGSLT